MRRYRKVLATYNGASAALARQHKRAFARVDSGPGDDYTKMMKLRRYYFLHHLRRRSVEERFRGRPGDVYAFGSGDTNQLGLPLGQKNIDRVLEIPTVIPMLRNMPVGVVQVACGGLHNIAVTASGRLLTWGCNDEGALGRVTGNGDSADSLEGAEEFPFQVRDGGAQEEIFVGAATGSNQSLALALSGKVYMFGSYVDDGRHFCDAHSPAGVCEKRFEPTAACGITDACAVACGEAFNAAVLLDGSVLTWGLGLAAAGNLAREVPPPRDAETGKADANCIFKYHVTPAKVAVEGDAKIFARHVACGSHHLVVVADSPDGEGTSVWAAGLNNYGQLGLGDTGVRTKLQRVTALDHKNVVRVACGLQHTIFLGRGGEVWACGRGDSGQLGITEKLPSAGFLKETPQLVSKLKGAVQVSCGDHHNFALTDSKEVFSWGFGVSNALGHKKSAEDEYQPRKMNLSHLPKNAKVCQVAGGGQHSLMLVE